MRRTIVAKAAPTPARAPTAAPPRTSPEKAAAKPKPIDDADKQKLTESYFTNLSPGTNFGFKMASAAIVACP